MQTCFFAISGVLPRDEAIERDQEGDQEDLRKKGEEVVRRTSRRSTARWTTCTR
jgi:pyruvate-ferredoxin/flavodoxin oxidoreductase